MAYIISFVDSRKARTVYLATFRMEFAGYDIDISVHKANAKRYKSHNQATANAETLISLFDAVDVDYSDLKVEEL